MRVFFSASYYVVLLVVYSIGMYQLGAGDIRMKILDLAPKVTDEHCSKFRVQADEQACRIYGLGVVLKLYDKIIK